MVKDQGQIHESLLEEHDDKLVINLRGDIPLVAEA
jgi:CMP-2-keto-3-deoxyoctulosonic acid synthetase